MINFDLFKHGVKGMKKGIRKYWISPKGNIHEVPNDQDHIDVIHKLNKKDNPYSSMFAAHSDGWLAVNGDSIRGNSDHLENKSSPAMTQARKIMRDSDKDNIYINHFEKSEDHLVSKKHFVKSGKVRETRVHKAINCFFNLFKSKGGHKYIRKIPVGGHFRYIYPSDLKGKKKRNIEHSAMAHVLHHNEGKMEHAIIDKEESAYIKDLVKDVYAVMKKQKIDPKNEQAYKKAFNKYLTDNGITRKQLNMEFTGKKLGRPINEFLDDVDKFHDIAVEVVRDHLHNDNMPMHKHLSLKEAISKKPKTKKEKIKATQNKVPPLEAGQPKPISDKHPSYHPLALPTIERKGKKLRYYTARYTKEVPPSGMDKELWGKALDQYIEQGGKVGYDFNWGKIKNIYSKLSGKEIDPYQRYKQTDMIARTYMKKNPPDFVEENKKLWGYVVDNYFTKDAHGTHIQKKDFDKGEAGLRKYFFNALNKYGNTDPRKLELKPKKKVAKSFYFSFDLAK